jgi:hypothetical protein
MVLSGIRLRVMIRLQNAIYGKGSLERKDMITATDGLDTPYL